MQKVMKYGTVDPVVVLEQFYIGGLAGVKDFVRGGSKSVFLNLRGFAGATNHADRTLNPITYCDACYKQKKMKVTNCSVPVLVGLKIHG